jgi:esterase/lipase superfamily enzyme
MSFSSPDLGKGKSFMRHCLYAAILLVSFPSLSPAGPLTVCTRRQLVKLNDQIEGCVVDLTWNHAIRSNRFWSEALGQKRDMYVYLPPGYDGTTKYPLMIWLHGMVQDEKDFLTLVPAFDKAIANGQLPPMVIAAPDGSITGRPSFIHAGSFYINSRAGRYEDYVIQDVYPYLMANFAIRPEHEAHVMAGASMGGFASFNLGIKHRDCFKIVVGIMPPLNLRYLDCKGKHMGDFDPNCWSYADRYRPHTTVGCFFHVFHVQEKHLIEPLFRGTRQSIPPQIARENPIEMLDAYGVKPNDLSMFIGYGAKDEFNIDAQVESFVHVARQRGIEPRVVVDPEGRHNSESGVKMMPEFAAWMTPLLSPYAPKLARRAPVIPEP